jgi:hypothetical protein
MREFVMPAQAGIQRFQHDYWPFSWIPAFAGMTPRFFSLKKPTPERGSTRAARLNPPLHLIAARGRLC